MSVYTLWWYNFVRTRISFRNIYTHIISDQFFFFKSPVLWYYRGILSKIAPTRRCERKGLKMSIINSASFHFCLHVIPRRRSALLPRYNDYTPGVFYPYYTFIYIRYYLYIYTRTRAYISFSVGRRAKWIYNLTLRRSRSRFPFVLTLSSYYTSGARAVK